MKNNSFTPMGALHPILFFAGVYIVALIFSVFICSALFYSCNTSSSKLVNEEKQVQPHNELNASSSVVLR
jgi:hypothetical protein